MNFKVLFLLNFIYAIFYKKFSELISSHINYAKSTQPASHGRHTVDRNGIFSIAFYYLKDVGGLLEFY